MPRKERSKLERLKRGEKINRGRSRRLYEKPNIVVQERLKKLRSDLVKVEPKETNDPDNICMHQHLKYIERAYQEDPVKIMHREAEKYEKKANEFQSKIKKVKNGN